MLLLRILDDTNSSKVENNYDNAYKEACFTEIRITLINYFIFENIEDIEIKTLLRKLFIVLIKITRFLLLKIFFSKINIEALKSLLIILLITLILRLLLLIKKLILLTSLILIEFSSNEINLREIFLI